MTTHTVQSIAIDVSTEEAFRVVADPGQLPRWTNAFAEVQDGKATLRTPRGEVTIGLQVHASRDRGTVDWEMLFPDGSTQTAYSRLVPAGASRSLFSFVLLAPETALEALEGGLEEQSAILAEELRKLKRLLEEDAES